MTTHSQSSRLAWRFLLVATTLTLAACDAVNELGQDDEDYFYVSIGTSLAVGVQPNSSGILLPTDNGYADVLYDSLRPVFRSSGENRRLKLVKYGCPGETFDSLVNGGSCPYVAGSQLDAAVEFIADNRDRIHLVTIDMGANDFRNADCIGTAIDADCVTEASNRIATDLAPVLATLRDAAGPNVRIVGMNYYNPYLASWLESTDGMVVAMASSLAAAILNDALSATYDTAGMTMADVYAAFDSDDFSTLVPTSLPPPNDQLPLAVANICSFTYMCDPDPVGPDVHATNAGYSLIATTIEDSLP